MQPQTTHYRDLLHRLRAHLSLLGYRHSSLSGAAEFLQQLEQVGILTLKQIKASHLKAHYAYLCTRPARYGGVLSLYTVQGYLQDIRLLLRWAEQTGQITISPMQDLRFPPPPKTERAILSKGEVRNLYAACVLPIERLTLSLFYGCGLRASEGAKLDLKDVDTRAQLLYVRQGKGRKRRVIPLTPVILEDIQAYVYEQRPQQIFRQTRGDHRQALALNRVGRRLQAQRYRSIFKVLLARCEQLRQDVSLHNLRHSIATHLLADGMAIERVRDFLGHDCLESTQIYTRVYLSML